jgi:hypothetical protein
MGSSNLEQVGAARSLALIREADMRGSQLASVLFARATGYPLPGQPAPGALLR